MLRWITIVGTLVMLATNGLANGLPINGKTTGDIADGFDILFTPAGYVFSIWGLIYLAVVGFTIFQALPAQKDDVRLHAIRPWFVLNTAANAGWILCWHHELFVLSLGVMFVIAASLAVIFRHLQASPPRSGIEFLVLHAPFSLYFGWISVATLANVTVVLATLGFTAAMASPAVTLVLLGLVTVICAVVSLRFADPVYAAVFVWASVGIGAANSDTAPLLGGSLTVAALCTVFALRAAAKTIRTLRANP